MRISIIKTVRLLMLIIPGIGTWAADGYRTVPEPWNEIQRGKWKLSVGEFSVPAELDPMGNWGEETEGFQMSLRFQTELFGATTNVFVRGQPISALLLVRNLGTNTAGFLDRLEFIVTRRGQQVPRYDEFKGNFELPGKRGLIKTNFFWIRPNTQRSFTTDMYGQFDFRSSGEYTITAFTKVPKRGSVQYDPQKASYADGEAPELISPRYFVGQPTFPDAEYVEIRSAPAIIYIVSDDVEATNSAVPETAPELANSTASQLSNTGIGRQQDDSAFQRATREQGKTPSIPSALAEATPLKAHRLTPAQKIGAGVATVLTGLLLLILWRAKSRQKRFT
jgi:hypothetical protein